jgi:putative SOS response-associated peptidase YedK
MSARRPDGERELTMMKWGFPPPNLSKAPVIAQSECALLARLAQSRMVLFRSGNLLLCVERHPANSVDWFALDETGVLFALADIWRLRAGERKGETCEHRLLAFLTTTSNHVWPSHAKAMLVLFTTG